MNIYWDKRSRYTKMQKWSEKSESENEKKRKSEKSKNQPDNLFIW